jgi:hypothetical protein
MSPNRGQNILDQLTLTRTTHIQSIINTHIIPVIEQQALYGIAKTTIAMLPSDIPLPAVEEKSEFSFSSSSSEAVEVIGFSSEDVPKVVRLQGQMNRTEFWRVEAIIADLERILRDTLNVSPVWRSSTGPSMVSSEEQQQRAQPKRRVLSRVMPSLGPEQRSVSGNPEVGIRQESNDVGLVLVKARLEEICLRTVNEFGLYDTMNRQCVMVKIDARC